MVTLIIATHNQHKAAEIQALLSGQFRIVTMRDFPNAPSVIEDANTFAGNAAKKSLELANWLFKRESIIKSLTAPAHVLADDSGLEVDALDGAPGVFSARFAAADGNGGNSSDADNNAKLLRLMQDVPQHRRSARFRCVLALTPIVPTAAKNAATGNSNPKAEITELFDGVCEGQIGMSASGTGGFGYDPLFTPVGEKGTFAELGEAVKNRLSHRAKALEKLRQRFIELENFGGERRESMIE